MSTEKQTSGLDATVVALAEVIAKDLFCAAAPKIKAALQKDIDNMGELHPIKKEFVHLAMKIVDELADVVGCPIPVNEEGTNAGSGN